MITACLKVRSSERPSCEQILKMPGLLNHLTGTLNDIEALKEETKSLMHTIRLPRKLGMITERMPASQYEASVRSSEKPSTADPNINNLGLEVTQNKLNRVASVPASLRLQQVC
jgi:hypothetical protein